MSTDLETFPNYLWPPEPEERKALRWWDEQEASVERYPTERLPVVDVPTAIITNADALRGRARARAIIHVPDQVTDEQVAELGRQWRELHQGEAPTVMRQGKTRWQKVGDIVSVGVLGILMGTVVAALIALALALAEPTTTGPEPEPQPEPPTSVSVPTMEGVLSLGGVVASDPGSTTVVRPGGPTPTRHADQAPTTVVPSTTLVGVDDTTTPITAQVVVPTMGVTAPTQGGTTSTTTGVCPTVGAPPGDGWEWNGCEWVRPTPSTGVTVTSGQPSTSQAVTSQVSTTQPLTTEPSTTHT